jgi:hypothetical protein
VIDSTVVFDSSSNRPGGFGFVSLEKVKGVEKVLEKEHFIKGARVSEILRDRLIVNKRLISKRRRRKTKKREREKSSLEVCRRICLIPSSPIISNSMVSCRKPM